MYACARMLDAFGRHRRHVANVVRRVAERVHHRVTQPFPESLVFQLLFGRIKVEICRLDCHFSPAVVESDEAEADAKEADQRARHGDDDHRDGRGHGRVVHVGQYEHGIVGHPIVNNS